MKLTTTNREISATAKKYCRVVFSEDAASSGRFIEREGGVLEYNLGVGKYKAVTVRKFRVLIRTAIQVAKNHQIEYLAISFPRDTFPKLGKYGEEWTVSTVTENILMAAYEFKEYKTTKNKPKTLKEVLVCGDFSKKEKDAFGRGVIVGNATSLTRDIANTSGADMFPNALSEKVKKIVRGTLLKITVLNEKQIKAKKMGLLEAVGKGAEHPPRFIIMEYLGGKKSEKPVVLIGKGITYDSGGINIKPSGHMHDMHLDMSGGAAVIGAMKAIAELRLKKNVVALIPAAENAVSDRAMRAGDIVTAMNGKTVEVIHTDAEGRMVLADAMTYAEKHYAPTGIIDAATLTGASLVALGKQASALMTTNETLQSKLTALGEGSGDLLWPLPLWDEYNAMLKSDRADMTNIDASFSRMAGAIEGGVFLRAFAPENVPWAHIDMAPRMVATASDKLAKGAAGEPVRLLVKFVEEY